MQTSDDSSPSDHLPTVGPTNEPAGAAGSPLTETVGSMIDRYRLLERIGEGGFGVVYMAEQREPVRRRVALKIIKVGMDTRQVVARFDAERQALAMMDHPNIARVLDGGATAAGRPFFVMELVRGIPMTDFCDREELSTRERLSLFIDVCHAVQHAHQKGIIHRDLKPNNVLVTLHDGKAVPKVIDFGIAKATNAELTEMTLFTEFRQFVGTPEYMSPEQASMSGLDIDTRSDVYSLGVLLYELLTGMHPFDARRLRTGGIQAIQKIICEEEPLKPSTRLSSLLRHRQSGDDSPNAADTLATIAKRRDTEPGQLARELRGDLDWVIMRCLEKDRTRRYATANELAEDIARHMADQPVRAGPPSATYKLRKMCRRHRAAFTVAALFAIAAAAAFAAIVYQWQRAETQQRSANAGWTEADIQRQEAETARDEAERVSLFLANMLREGDPEESGRDITVVEVLDDAARQIPIQFPDSPLIEARLRYTIGSTYFSLGQLNAAERQLQLAYDIRHDRLGQYTDQTLVAASGLAQVYAAQGKFAESEELQTIALAIAEHLHGRQHERTIGLLNNLASFQMTLGQFGKAEQTISDALSAAETLPEDHLYRLKAMGTRGLMLYRQGRHREAIAALEDLLNIQRTALPADHPDTLATGMNIANAHVALAEFERAVEMYLDLLPRYGRTHGPSALATLNLKVNLALVYSSMNRMEEAGELADATYRELVRTAGPVHPSTLEAAGLAGTALAAQGKHDLAEGLLRELVSDHENLLGPVHPRTLSARRSLLQFYRERGNTEEIDAQTAHYLQVLTTAATREDADADTLNTAAWELLTAEPEHRRNLAAALGFAQRAVDMTARTDAYVLDTLGVAQLANGLFDEAIATFQLALTVINPDDPNRAEIQAHLDDAKSR